MINKERVTYNNFVRIEWMSLLPYNVNRYRNTITLMYLIIDDLNQTDLSGRGFCNV